MPWYRMSGIGHVHFHYGGARQTAKHAPKHCRATLPGGIVCAGMAEFECDWPGCNKALCRECARPIGDKEHLCPEHRAQPGLDIGEGEGEQLSIESLM